jgi:hypothetical protein
MKLRPLRSSPVRAIIIIICSCLESTLADEEELPAQLTLADLAAYRIALTGKSTKNDAEVSDRPTRVTFSELWHHPLVYRGRRVTIEGRVARIFRQGPVGSFPALAEVWIDSTDGGPFCVVAPQDKIQGTVSNQGQRLDGAARSRAIPQLGQSIRFTGTFLKLLRYAAGDGNRLTPLIVGDEGPVPTVNARTPRRKSSNDSGHEETRADRFDAPLDRSAGSLSTWALAILLAGVAAGVLAWQHCRTPRVEKAHWRAQMSMEESHFDPSLAFVNPRDGP